MAKYKIVTPDGKGYSLPEPEEGKLFRGSGAPGENNLYMMVGGKVAPFRPGTYLNSIGKLNVPGTERGLYSNAEQVQAAAFKELGIDTNTLKNLPTYNVADLMGYRGQTTPLTGDQVKQAYQSNSFATEGGAPITEVFGAEIPKIVSGEGGPKDAQGNPIAPADYAKYGITDTKPATPTFQTTAGSQGQTNYWKSPSGTIVGAPAGSEAENNFKNLGWTQSTSAEEVAGRQVQNISPTGEIQTTTGGQAGQAPTTGQTPVSGQTPTAGQTQNNQWVNDYYQKYFDRPATQAELDNWGKETPQNLESFLKQEAQRYGYTSKANQTEEQQRLQAAYDKIDGSNLPPELKQLYKDIVKNYPPGIEFDANKILNTFTKIKNETIDPQYRNYVAQAEKGFSQNLASLEQSRMSELEQQRSQSGQAIRQAKEGLEKAGMTFTGKAIETLGAEAAIPQGQTGELPKQEPFGGYFYEGEVPQYNRLTSTSSQARYEDALKSLGLQAEQQLGTAGMAKFGISGYTPVGGTTGTIEEQKKQNEAQTLQQLLQNYQQKQQANTNLTFNS